MYEAVYFILSGKSLLVIDFNISFEGNAYEDKAIKHYFPFDVACDLDHEDIVKELVNRVSLTTIKRNLRVGQKFKVTKLLQERMHQEYLPKMLLLILGQQQPNSPLSVLHHNLLQDIQKVIKEKYFL